MLNEINLCLLLHPHWRNRGVSKKQRIMSLHDLASAGGCAFFSLPGSLISQERLSKAVDHNGKMGCGSPNSWCGCFSCRGPRSLSLWLSYCQLSYFHLEFQGHHKILGPNSSTSGSIYTQGSWLSCTGLLLYSCVMKNKSAAVWALLLLYKIFSSSLKDNSCYFLILD